MVCLYVLNEFSRELLEGKGVFHLFHAAKPQGGVQGRGVWAWCLYFRLRGYGVVLWCFLRGGGKLFVQQDSCW